MNKVFDRGTQERLAFDTVAGLLTLVSPKGIKYYTYDTWEDYGAGIAWTTICYDGDFGGVQILSPRQWDMVVHCETVDDYVNAVKDIRSDKYFADKDVVA